MFSLGILTYLTDKELVLEDRTDDLAANAGNAGNAGKMWMRSDLTTATVKMIVNYGSGTYAVKTCTIT